MDGGDGRDAGAGRPSPASRAVRAGSFGRIAEDYDRYRPGPPAAAVEWLVPPGAAVAVDLGAGTGALSAELQGRVAHVVAVEADRRMVARLGRRAPGATAAVGRAEALPLARGQADLVGVSSAWHWMDPALVVPEIARVLRPGGVLGVLWSGPDRSVRWVADVLSPARRGGAAGPDQDGGRRRGRRLELPSGEPFDDPVGRTWTTTVPYRVEDLVGLVASFSAVITLPDDERAAVLGDAAARVAAHDELRGVEVVELPLRCRCWRALRH